MKFKTILACAVLGLVIFNGRLNAAVESDIVGYTTITMEADKWYIVGNPFVALDGSDTCTINGAFVGAGFAKNDILYVLQPDGVFVPNYWNQANSGWSKHKILWQEDTTQYPNSTAVYLYKASAGSLTFAGKVSSVAVDVGDEAGNAWSLTSFVCPEEKKLNQYTWTGFAANDLLYTMDDAGVFTPHYWNQANSGWSKHKILWQENTTPLAIGQAVYLFKKSTGIGSISH